MPAAGRGPADRRRRHASRSAPSPTRRPAPGSTPMSPRAAGRRSASIGEHGPGRGRCRSAAISRPSGGWAGRGSPSSACAAASSIRSPGGPSATPSRTALLLARQRDFSGAALHDLFEAEAKQLWKKRELLRAVTAALAARRARGAARAARPALRPRRPALIAALPRRPARPDRPDARPAGAQGAAEPPFRRRNQFIAHSVRAHVILSHQSWRRRMRCVSLACFR